MLNVRVPIDTLVLDTNGNGLPDWWEIRWFGAITNISALSDSDSDGTPNINEYVASTDPLSAGNPFRITSLRREGPNLYLSYSCYDSRVYSVQQSAGLVPGSWADVLGATRILGTSTGSTVVVLPAPPSNVVIRVVVDFP
jgi:hypothetical protein